MNFSIVELIVGAVATLIGAIIGAYVQIKNYNSSNKKNDSDITASLIDRALKISQEEIANQKALYTTLKEEYKEQFDKNKELRIEKDTLEDINRGLEEKIAVLETKVEQLEQKLSDCVSQEEK